MSLKRLELEHEAQANEKFVSVTEQTKNEVRSKVIDHIRETIIKGFGYCPPEDESLVVDMSELSKCKMIMPTEVYDYITNETVQETRTLDRLEVDCGDGLWIYDTEEYDYDAKDLDTDVLFGIGILVDKWFHNIKSEKPYTTYRSGSANENERTITDNI